MGRFWPAQLTHGRLQIPRFAFEKFPGAKAELTTQMKSVGEAMAIGRTFQVASPALSEASAHALSLQAWGGPRWR